MMKVLVVDDQEDGRLLMDKLLAARGHRVVAAESGRSALARAREETPDLVLSDVLMPQMDGYALCRDLKSDPELAHIPLVFYSATFLDAEEERLALDLGARGFLRKPFEIEALDAVLSQVAASPRDTVPAPENLRQLNDRYEEVLSTKLAAKVTELEAVQRSLTTLMGNLPGMVYRRPNDHRWQLTFASGGAKALTGFAPEELSGPGEVHYGDLIPATVRKRLRQEVDEAIAHRRPYQLVYPLTRSDGQQRWMWDQGQQVPGDDGRPVLEGYVADITAEREQEERLREATTALVRAIALTVEKRDPYTAGHMERVAEIATAIAIEMGLAPEPVEGIRLGALVHDIGKVYIPAEILNRPGRLSTTEFDLIKTHPTVGWEILRDFDFPWPLADMVVQHHERLDGSGYPQGLEEAQILPEAKILAVADVVEAMTSHRPYRPALEPAQALEAIREGRGHLYDPAVVDAFMALVDTGRLPLTLEP